MRGRTAGELPPGPARDDLLRKMRQADTAMRLDDWLNSPGLRPPSKAVRFFQPDTPPSRMRHRSNGRNASECRGVRLCLLRAHEGDMDWLLYAVLIIGLIVVAMRLSAWLLFKNDK